MARTTTCAGVESHRLDDAAAAMAHVVDGCLTDGPVGRVGLELEAHCFDVGDPSRRPSWAQLTEVIADLPVLPGGSIVTVEPGGAVELSGPPAPDPVTAISGIAADRAVLRDRFAEAGLGLVLLGADPLRPPGRVNPGARYRAMEEFFRLSGTGAAGAAMMTATASLQVNLEAGPRAQWAQRVRLAHALGPTLVAIAANSPALHGDVTGWQSSRQRVWSRLDTARCGPILGSGDDPAADWAHYALRAPLMLVHTPEPEPVRDGVSFADWADGRVLLGGRRPTVADLDYHLTTLFPPVRPRGFLEIRYLDSVPDALWPALAFTTTVLLDDPAAADIAAEATEPVAAAWDRAAQIGLADPELHRAARRCVEAAARRAPRQLQESMDLLQRSVEQARCPADDFTEQAATHGIDGVVGRMARGEL
ncbi:ergothioneine biosynthesis glutamate--cysteine ligase EgtA [Mycolicibacterium vaccae]|uniref:ergothioneine biosynthesis glutamate--cysteine ligase EgtA n=1 Tax=Mycolicibacterium vaccae TaxID=1810 RepID=UPI003CFD36F5